MRSKVDISQLNLPHETNNEIVKILEQLKVQRNQIYSEVSVNSPGNPWSHDSEEEKEGYGGKNLKKRKVLSLE